MPRPKPRRARSPRATSREAKSRKGRPALRQAQGERLSSPVRSEPVEPRTPPLSFPTPEPATELPSSYDADLIVLQPRDPWWLHAYWEFRADTLHRGRERLGAQGARAEWILRVYEEESSRWFDIHLTPQANDWYIEVNPPGRAWTVEIGFKAPSGAFVALARSNTVSTPPDRPSDLIDEKWGVLREIAPTHWGGSSWTFSIGS